MRHVLCGLVLGLVVVLTGCTGHTTMNSSSGTHQADKDLPPPHGGKWFATTDEVHHHIELVTDKDKPAMAYIYKKDQKTPVPTDDKEMTLTITGSKTPITFKPTEQKGDPAGKASAFTSKEKVDASGWKDADWENISIAVKIDGTPYIFKLDKD